MRLSAPVAVLLACLALAAPAAAQEDKVYAPPGNSGIEEYLEVVPGGGGDKPASGDPGESSASPSPARSLGADNAQKLEALGPDGEAAAAAAASGSPTESGAARQRQKTQLAGAPRGQSITAQNGGDRATSVVRALGGEGGGMGVLFPILLGLALTFVLALGLRRKLRRG